MQLPFLNGESTIQLFQGIPWDSTNKDFVRFSSVSAQNAYFANRPHKSFDEYAPVQEFPGVVTLGVCADEIYNYNYARWKNTNKWYYAFIQRVEYKNPGSCLVTFALDFMQTYWFDWNFGDCTIEREHVDNDSVFANYTPETLTTTAPYVANRYFTPLENDSANVLVVETSEDIRGIIDNPSMEGKAFACYAPTKFSYAGKVTGYRASWLNVFFVGSSVVQWAEVAQSLFAGLSGKLADALKSDAVLSTYLLPLSWIEDEGVRTIDLSKELVFQDNELDKYQPVNKKLFHAPFSYLRFFSPSQGCVDIEKEYIKGARVRKVININGTDSTATYFLEEYKNHQPFDPSNGFALSSTGAASVAYATDTYRAFLAQRLYSNDNTIFQLETIQSIYNPLTSIAMSAAAGDATGALTQGVNAAYNVSKSLLARAGEESLAIQKPQVIKGTSSAVSPTFRVNWGRATVTRVSWPDWALRQADNYLTRYGYRVNRVGIPLTHSRTRFNYVETSDCVLKPGAIVPADVLPAIKAVFNGGVTIWHDPAFIGDYTTPNPIK